MLAKGTGIATLVEPKSDVKDAFVKEIEKCMLSNKKAKAQLIKAFKKQSKPDGKRITGKVVCKIAAKRLLNKALQMRKEHAGSLLKTTRTIQGMIIGEKKDFGVGCHMASTEPFFYDTAYKHVKKDCALPIDENGKCVLANVVNTQCEGKKTKYQNPSHEMRMH